MKIEIRSDRVTIEGYVNAVARDSKPIMMKSGKGFFVEQIEPGAWGRALKRNKDIKLMFNHDKKIGGIKEGNLQLREDNIGLKVKCEVRDKEVIEKAKKGKLTGWSFGFKKIKDTWKDTKGIMKRIVNDLDLREVSILDTIPAYEGTLVEVRNGAGAEEDIEIRSITKSENTIDGYVKDFLNGVNAGINVSRFEEDLIIDGELEKRCPLIARLKQLGNFTEELIGTFIKYEVVDDGETLKVLDTYNVGSKRKPLIIKDIYEDFIEKNGTKFIENILLNKIISDLEKRLCILFNTVENEYTVENVDGFINLLGSIPRAYRRDLVIIGNCVEIATLKRLFAKEGIYDFFGIEPIIQEGIEGLYIVSLIGLFINFKARATESRKRIDVYDFKVVTYGGEAFTGEEAVKRIIVN